MDIFASNLIAALGGSTAVSRMTSAPVSTVHSWKHNGIPQSRLAHLRLIAEKESIAVDWETGMPANEQAPAAAPSPDHAPASAAMSATKTDENICSADGPDGEGGHGHPFAPPSSAISSPTIAPPQSSLDSPASSAGGEVTA